MLAVREIERKPRRLAGCLDPFATDRVVVGIGSGTPMMKGVSLKETAKPRLDSRETHG